MAIEPNTTVEMFLNVPLDVGYNHTYYFDNLTQQTQFFTNYPGLHIILDEYSYQRVDNNRICIGIPYKQCYNYSYMRFKNTSYENKWFYAFITSVQYDNDNTTIIEYTIDYLQSWFFDFTFADCFVEREHTSSDNLYEHYIEENLETGEYITNDSTALINFPSFNTPFDPDNISPSDGERVFICVVITERPLKTVSGWSGTTPVKGRLINKTYQGCAYYLFDPNNEEALNTLGEWLEIYKSSDMTSLVNIYMQPILGLVIKKVSVQDYDNQTTLLNGVYEITGLTQLQKNAPANFQGNFDGYTPKNKKLYCAPYVYNVIDNQIGGTINLMPQFTTSTTSLTLLTDIGASNGIIVNVKNYLKKGTQTTNYSLSVTLSDFPQCSWSNDLYAAWYAQNQNKLFAQQTNIQTQYSQSQLAASSSALVQILGGVLALAAAPTTGGLSAAAVFGASSIASGAINYGVQSQQAKITAENNIRSLMAQITDKQILGSSLIGSTGCQNAIFNCTDEYGIYYRHQRITGEYAKIIDGYFTMYGYKVQKVKKPSLKNRTRFTYIKTCGCVIHPSQTTTNTGYTQSADTVISQIFDKGITLWVANISNEVGDYETPNNPIN